jgi:hypothetical protein
MQLFVALQPNASKDGDEDFFREQFFDNAINDGSDDEWNSAAGERTAATHVVPANAVAIAPAKD